MLRNKSVNIGEEKKKLRNCWVLYFNSNKGKCIHENIIILTEEEKNFSFFFSIAS